MSNSDVFLGSQGKILNIFEYFIKKNDFVTVEEISNLFNLSKSGSFRILNILRKKGFINFLEKKKSYILSDKFTEITFNALMKNPILFIIEKMMLNLKNRINEDIFISKLEENKINIIKNYSIFNNLYFKEDKFPIYASSSGKIFLTFMKKLERENIIKKIIFKKFTNNTITEKDILINEIKRIRKEGFSTSIEEYKMGFCDFSIPIYDKKNKNIYALSVIFPKYKLSQNYKNFLIKELFSFKKDFAKKLKQFYKIFS